MVCMKPDDGVIAFPGPPFTSPSVDDLRSLSTWLSRILFDMNVCPPGRDLVIIRGPADDAPGGPIPEGHVWIGGDAYYEMVPAAQAIDLIRSCYLAHITAYRQAIDAGATADIEVRRARWRDADTAIAKVFALLARKRLATVIRILRGASRFIDDRLHTVEIDGERWTVIGIDFAAADGK